MSKLILTDIDDTVLNYVIPFRAWMEGKGYHPVRPFGEVYNLGQIYGLDDDRAMALIEEFTHSDVFGELKAETCAKEVLPRLKEAGYRFVAISATVDSKENRDRRMQNLANEFGFEFEDCFCTGLRLPKTPYLESYRGKSDIWVEDNFFHAVDGAEMGHETFIITRKYNEGMSHEKVRRVETWHEIESYLSW
jgi:hypothetical protein